MSNVDHPSDDELWRTLRAGDRFKLAHLPFEFSEHEYTLHDDTLATYLHLIDSQQELTIDHLDEQGFPWTKFTTEDDNQQIEYHSLMINHDGIVITSRAM